MDKNYITDYFVEKPKFNILTNLYLISADIERNDIIEVLITGYKYDFFESGNKLTYAFVEYPVPSVYGSRLTDYVRSTEIDSGALCIINGSQYFVCSTVKNAIYAKEKHLANLYNSTIEKLNKLSENLD